MEKTPIPKFCPKGCGETLEVVSLQGLELEMVQEANPDFSHHWKIRCKTCGHNSYLSEGMDCE